MANISFSIANPCQNNARKCVEIASTRSQKLHQKNLNPKSQQNNLVSCFLFTTIPKLIYRHGGLFLDYFCIKQTDIFFCLERLASFIQLMFHHVFNHYSIENAYKTDPFRPKKLNRFLHKPAQVISIEISFHFMEK